MCPASSTSTSRLVTPTSLELQATLRISIGEPVVLGNDNVITNSALSPVVGKLSLARDFDSVGG